MSSGLIFLNPTSHKHLLNFIFSHSKNIFRYFSNDVPIFSDYREASLKRVKRSFSPETLPTLLKKILVRLNTLKVEIPFDNF